MKSFKKGLLYFFMTSLVFVLVACGSNKDEKTGSKNEPKVVTLSDILNGKDERQIVMTTDTDNTKSPQIKWAGIIGNGKLEIHPYANKDNFEFDEIKDLKLSDYKQYLKSEDEDYTDYGENEELNIKPEKADLLVGYDKAKKTTGLMYDVKSEGNEKDQKAAHNYAYIDTTGPHQDGWMSIQTAEARDISNEIMTPFVMHVKKKSDNEILKIEDKEKDENKYKNVRFIDIS